VKQFVRGQKSRFSDITESKSFKIALGVNASTQAAFDISCFGLDEQEKLSDDRYFIFFNQKNSPCHSLNALGPQEGDKEVFQINLDSLPSSIRKLVFTITIDGTGTMSQITSGYLRIIDKGEVGRFVFSGNDFKDEKAIIIGEIYLKDVWRFAAVGQGFNGGLSALLKHFGGEEIQESPPPPVNVQKPVVQAETIPAPPKRVVLEKPDQSHKVSLTKGSNNLIIVRAQWVDNNDGRDDNDDLDLRVGILFPNGQMGIVHADYLGSLTQFPFVQHLGDVRQPGEEIVQVRSDISKLLGGKVALVFSVYSAVQNGAVSIASLKPKMKMEYGDQVVECAYDFSQLGKASSGSFFGRLKNSQTYIYTYVIGLAIIEGETAEIKPSGMVSAPHSEATPRLCWSPKGDITLTIDGPHVFKSN
jgi:tellurite resistance protein TerA